MYHAHFGMHTDPFPLSPKLVFVYQSKAFGETMAHLVYGIEQDEDIILITGGIGTGKTLAVHYLLNQVARHLRPVLVNVTRMTFEELLKYILLELDQRVEGRPDIPDLLQQLKAVLRDMRRDGRKVLIIIDEAQQLDADTLEGLRLVLNLSSPEEQVLQLILVGQPALESTIGRPQLAQLNQRIRVRYRLEPLSRREVEEYIDHRDRVAGCPEPLFKSGAFDRIYELSQGIPRVVNILASRGLLAAFVDGKRQVEAKHVRAEDLPPVTDETPLFKPAAAPFAGATAAPAEATPRPPLHTPGGPSIEDTVRPVNAVPYPGPTAAFGREPTRRGRGRLALAILLPVVATLVVLGFWKGPDLVRTFTRQPTNTTDAMMPARAEVGNDAGDHGSPLASDAMAAPASTTAPGVAGKVAVHVASFRDPAGASRLVSRLQAQGYAAFSRPRAVDGKTWYRVCIGPFADRAAATAAESRLHQTASLAYTQLIPYGE